MPKKKSSPSVRLRNSTAEFLTFAYQTGGDGVEVRVQDGTIWLSQKNMGALFETTPENVLMHLRRIFGDLELDEGATTKDFLAVTEEFSATASDGKNYRIKHYNLNAIIAEIDHEHAEGEFEKYRVIQDRLFRSGFDTFVGLEDQGEIDET